MLGSVAVLLLVSIIFAQAKSENPNDGLGLDSEPKALKQVAPDFPTSLIAEGVSRGYAEVIFMLGADGIPAEVVVLEASHPLLGEKVREALPKWKFEPPTKAGQPTHVRLIKNITIEYKRTVSSQTIMDFTNDRMALKDQYPQKYRIAEIKDLDARPQPVVTTAPLYPEAMQGSSQPGQVVMDFYISPEGQVRCAAVHKASHPAFGLEAYRAFLNWQFSPPMVRGAPVWCHARMPLKFEPPTP